MEHFSISGTGIAQSALDTVLSAWGVPGIVSVLAVGAVIWWTKATSGLRAEQEIRIARQEARIAALVQEKIRLEAEKDRVYESYLAIKHPGSRHRDVLAETEHQESP